jgi:hypothetical protein
MPPQKKGNVGCRKTGGPNRQSVVPAARLGTVVGLWSARRPGLLANQNWNKMLGRRLNSRRPASPRACWDIIVPVIPGRVTEEEQRIKDQISWQITSWHETTKEVAEETKSAKEQIEKMTKRLKMMRDTRDLTDGSVEYAIDATLCADGVDRKVYHGQCLIGPPIMKLLANRVEIMSQLEMKFLHVQNENLA